MIHIMDGDWRLYQQDLYIDCRELYAYIRMKNIEPQTVDINMIAHKELDSISTDDFRFLKANIQLPGILAKDMTNPLGRQFRMLDGRHRLKKIMLSGDERFSAYVISQTDALRFVRQLT
jgi:hypothetical protein